MVPFLWIFPAEFLDCWSISYALCDTANHGNVFCDALNA